MPRRAWLYVPGDQERKLVKAATLEADVVCLDLEDAVAPDRKVEARELVARALESHVFQAGEVWIRVNAPTTPWAEADMALVRRVAPSIRGVLLPKTDASWVMHWAARHLQQAEETHALPPGRLALAALIETARGLVHAETIARATSRLQVLLFGAEDLAADLGALRTPEGREVAYARSRLLVAARAFGLQAIDMVYIAYKDLEGLEREAREAARLGFDGKQIIHPAQVPVVQAAFAPPEDQLQWARQVWQAYQEAQQEGRGVFVVEGKMIDPPLIRQARRILERAGEQGKAVKR